MKHPALLLFAALAAAPALHAQAVGHAHIDGTITDSVHAAPAANATVLLTRISPEPSEFRSAITDPKGRFHFDTLLAGRYTVAFATPYLDSLDITIPPREVNLGDGQAAHVDFAMPSGATLRAAACPGIDLARGHGAVLGQVTDADTDRPLPAAVIAASWSDLSVDSATLKPITTQRSGSVLADSLGHYRLCGVPTNTYLMVQVQSGVRTGSVLTMTVDDAGGVLVHDLSLSAASATGTASLSGIVRGSEGHPLSQAQVRVRNATGVTFTDSLGRFTLTGLPAGSQLLDVRRIGYLLGQVPIELRNGRTVDVAVTLRRIVTLDSIRIVARRNAYSDFERRRKEGFGRFLDEKQVEKLHPMEASQIFREMLGFRVEGEGLETKLYTTHGKFDLSYMGKNLCEVNVVINGVEHQDINFIDPHEIGAVEAYPGPAGAPIQYDRACGVVVIWTKR